ncbi:MAG: acyltransferase domain-containing protein, partial [Pseudomonadota bacterium]
TVVSGDFDAIGAMKQNFDEANLLYTELKTSHAFHSRMMARAATEFVSIFDDVRIRKPNCEVTSTVDAGAPRDALCTAEYWTNQITSPVRFANAVVSASSQSGTLFVELGPGNALTGMMQQSLPATANCRAIAISPSAGDILENPDSVVSALFNGVGACWGAGVDVDWSKVNGGSHFKTDLPSYPLERKSHWIEPTHQETEGQFRQSEKTQVEADDTTIATQEENRRGIDVESVVQKQLDIVEAQIALLKRGSQ